MTPNAERSFTAARSTEEAMAARQRGAAVLAGGTWMMRDPGHGADLPAAVVSLHRIPALSKIEIGSEVVVIGSAVTHAVLGRVLKGIAGFEGLVAAAEGAANPGVRRLATVGGNLCALDFAAADLVPALLVFDATIELETSEGPTRIGIADFLQDRRSMLPEAIVTRIHVPRDLIAAAHVRLPLRKAGDYPVAIVSLALDKGKRCRIAVGAVESVARRWTALERAMVGPASPLNPERAAELALQHNDFHGHEGAEAESWYRRQVLSPLVRRGVAALLKMQGPA